MIHVIYMIYKNKWTFTWQLEFFINTQNLQYWHQRRHKVKTKKSSNENATPVSTEPGTLAIQDLMVMLSSLSYQDMCHLFLHAST